uniref:Uncharacterized protein n=1 Tax=Arundo donax TaxID=35708 RepID=A0A0A9DJ70_ARUDO
MHQLYLSVFPFPAHPKRKIKILLEHIRRDVKLDPTGRI